MHFRKKIKLGDQSVQFVESLRNPKCPLSVIKVHVTVCIPPIKTCSIFVYISLNTIKISVFEAQ